MFSATILYVSFVDPSSGNNPSNQNAIDQNSDAVSNGGAGQDSVGTIDAPRSAMMFTSSLRRAILDSTSTQRNTQLTAQNKLVNPSLANPSPLTSSQDAIVQAATQLNAEAGYQDKGQITDLTQQMKSSTPYIVMDVNPHTNSFKQPKRYTPQATQTGTVFHHFTDDKGQNNDVLKITFAGNTGNIWGGAREPEDVSANLARLRIWHNLYQLTREPMLLTNGQENVFSVFYSSPTIPVPIEFQGFFSTVLEWSQVGSKPHSMDYSMEFTVTRVVPDMNTLTQNIMEFVTGFISLG